MQKASLLSGRSAIIHRWGSFLEMSILNKKSLTLLITLFLILVALGFFLINLKSKSSVSGKTYPEISNYPYFSVSDIYKKFWEEDNLSTGYYNTEGHVQTVEKCGREACPGEAIVISSSNNNNQESTLRVYVKNSNQFKIGNKYQFSLEAINDSGGKIIHLVGYSN